MIAVGVILLAVIGIQSASRLSAPTWEPRNGLAQIARRLQKDALRGVANNPTVNSTRIQATFYVYAEPGLLFHLASESVAVAPAGNFGFLTIKATQLVPTFFVAGPHALRDRQFTDQLAAKARHVKLLATYSYDASDFVRLDEVRSDELRQKREPLEIRLYQVLPEPDHKL